ncbi:unnamed protein product [Candida verbasci]|uniref:diphosphoinositol-polyphosphate diphosphatase n=1 Tax=Candida verbasci TaxID=1227364 RepID=A0A9W4XJJ6_9ASCO|nr:unnamed protein product [Candida verbasci]
MSMTDLNDDPFQMDEDFDSSSNKKLIYTSSNSIPPSQNDIHYMRSNIEQLKLENNNTTTNTTEEEEKFEEDLDDKLDLNLQNKIQLEYEKQQLDNLPLTPPENFALVVGKIYRSSFPQPSNFSFLNKLNLNSILCLIPEDYPILQNEFLQDNNIKLFQLGMSGNKEPFVKISSELITEAAKIVLNPKNQPILIHCNRGKHRTGCLIGVIRRLQNWSLTIIFDEYRKFASPKERPMDQQFIELYDDAEIKKHCHENNLLPLKWD